MYDLCMYVHVLCMHLNIQQHSSSQFKSQFIYFHIYYCVAYTFVITLLARFMIFFLLSFFLYTHSYDIKAISYIEITSSSSNKNLNIFSGTTAPLHDIFLLFMLNICCCFLYVRVMPLWLSLLLLILAMRLCCVSVVCAGLIARWMKCINNCLHLFFHFQILFKRVLNTPHHVVWQKWNQTKHEIYSDVSVCVYLLGWLFVEFLANFIYSIKAISTMRQVRCGVKKKRLGGTEILNGYLWLFVMHNITFFSQKYKLISKFIYYFIKSSFNTFWLDCTLPLAPMLNVTRIIITVLKITKHVPLNKITSQLHPIYEILWYDAKSYSLN